MLSYSSKCFDLEKLQSLQRMKKIIPVSHYLLVSLQLRAVQFLILDLLLKNSPIMIIAFHVRLSENLMSSPCAEVSGSCGIINISIAFSTTL